MYLPILFFRKDSEDWGWGEDSGWSDVKSNSSIDKTSKKTTTSSNSTVGGLAAKKKSEKSKNQPTEPEKSMRRFAGSVGSFLLFSNFFLAAKPSTAQSCVLTSFFPPFFSRSKIRYLEIWKRWISNSRISVVKTP